LSYWLLSADMDLPGDFLAVILPVDHAYVHMVLIVVQGGDVRAVVVDEDPALFRGSVEARIHKYLLGQLRLILFYIVYGYVSFCECDDDEFVRDVNFHVVYITLNNRIEFEQLDFGHFGIVAIVVRKV